MKQVKPLKPKLKPKIKPKIKYIKKYPSRASLPKTKTKKQKNKNKNDLMKEKAIIQSRAYDL